jgi:hypothetical protein
MSRAILDAPMILPVLRLADHLLCRVAEDALSTFVPARDNTIEVFADDRVVERIHNRGQEQIGRGEDCVIDAAIGIRVSMRRFQK